MERWRSYKHWIDMTRPSQPPMYRNVTGKTNDIVVLNCLENMFKRYTHVLENDFLQEFATLGTIPNIVNPKCIIQEMLQKYFSNLVRVYREPDFSETFIFIFYVGLGDYKRKYVFSNCMKFNEDVNIICFLHHITLLNVIPNYYFERCETVQILTRLMRNKYGIDIGDTNFLPIENKFTMSAIANCFPSITWDMYHNNCNDPAFSKIFADYSVLFPDFDLPKTIFLPMIVMVLPKLEELPIAILVAIFIKLRDFYMPAEPKYSLELAYNQILEIYNYSIVPERLKLNLCMKWNIAVKENNVYKFAPCFAENRLKAKHLILKLIPNDPKLNDILLKI